MKDDLRAVGRMGLAQLAGAPPEHRGHDTLAVTRSGQLHFVRETSPALSMLRERGGALLIAFAFRRWIHNKKESNKSVSAPTLCWVPDKDTQ